MLKLDVHESFHLSLKKNHLFTPEKLMEYFMVTKHEIKKLFACLETLLTEHLRYCTSLGLITNKISANISISLGYVNNFDMNHLV